MIKTNRKKKLGYYEKRLCVLLFLSSIPNAFPVIQTLVTQFTPPHYCDLTDLIKATEEKVSAALFVSTLVLLYR